MASSDIVSFGVGDGMLIITVLVWTTIETLTLVVVVAVKVLEKAVHVGEGDEMMQEQALLRRLEQYVVTPMNALVVLGLRASQHIWRWSRGL